MVIARSGRQARSQVLSRLWPPRRGRGRGVCVGLFSSCSCHWTSLIYYSSYITLFWCMNFHSHDFMLKNILKPRLCLSQPPRSWVSLASCRGRPQSWGRTASAPREAGWTLLRRAGRPCGGLQVRGEPHTCHRPAGPGSREGAGAAPAPHRRARPGTCQSTC